MGSRTSRTLASYLFRRRARCCWNTASGSPDSETIFSLFTRRTLREVVAGRRGEYICKESRTTRQFASRFFPFLPSSPPTDSNSSAQFPRYINGLDVDSEGKLHVSWTYRDYVPVSLEKSRQQAGPNGPENVSPIYLPNHISRPTVSPTTYRCRTTISSMRRPPPPSTRRRRSVGSPLMVTTLVRVPSYPRQRGFWRSISRNALVSRERKTRSRISVKSRPAHPPFIPTPLQASSTKKPRHSTPSAASTSSIASTTHRECRSGSSPLSPLPSALRRSVD